jgi:hypothetical protein
MTTAKLRALLAASTPGPWEVNGRGIDSRLDVAPWSETVVDMEERGAGYMRYDALVLSEPDAALICAAVNALPELLRIVEAVAKLDGINGPDGCWACPRGTTPYRHDEDCAWLAARGMGG